MKFEDIFALHPVNRTAKEIVSQKNVNEEFLLSARERHSILVKQLHELEANLSVWRKSEPARYKKAIPRLEELKRDIGQIKKEIRSFQTPKDFFAVAASRLLPESQLQRIWELAAQICEENKKL